MGRVKQFLTRDKFSYTVTTKGLLLTLALELLLIFVASKIPEYVYTIPMNILSLTLLGGLTILILSTEVVREIKNDIEMLLYMIATIFQYVLFFAFQYWFAESYAPGAFAGFTGHALDYFYNSLMIFVLNPLVVPKTDFGYALMLAQLFGALALIFFVLQNMWQFREKRD